MRRFAQVAKVFTPRLNTDVEGAVTTFLQWIVLSHRYRYASNNSGIATLMGIVGGFCLASVLIWLVFHFGVEESRLSVWMAGCAVAGLVGGVIIYRVMLPHGLCWSWFGC